MVLFPAGKDKMNTMDDQLLGNKELPDWPVA
jgi:hypothetical protein